MNKTDHTETAWQEISAAALLGTQRKPFQSVGLIKKLLPEVEDKPESGGANQVGLSPSTGRLPKQSERGEDLLLKTTAVVSLYRRAGRLPPKGSIPGIPICPPETKPRCSPQTGESLEQILASGRMPLLAEWAKLAARWGVRVREEHLPDLFSQLKEIQALRSVLLPVLGERGRWLAGQNRDWSIFASFKPDQVWQEGRRVERMACLSELRARDPQAARELLVSTWAQEAPGERILFLPVLADGLSMADEPFLESVLDDRRKDIRQSAAGLLVRLPGSRLVERMTRRARNLLSWKQGLLRGSIEVNLPEQCDPSLLRDGLEEKPAPNLALGEKAWWLVQILAAVPPSTWTQAWYRKPGIILETTRKQEWEQALVTGWTEAALHFEDSEWLDEIFAYEARWGDTHRMSTLFARLPEVKKDPAMTAMLRDNPGLSHDQPSSQWLSNCRFPWSRKLTQQVTTCICWTLQRGDLQPWRWEILLREIGPYFHPELLVSAIDRIEGAQKKREKPDPYANELLAVLQFRLEMYRTFDEVSP